MSEPENTSNPSTPAPTTALPDLLQAGQNRLVPQINPDSRFRKRYRPLAEHELALNDAIKDQAAKLEYLINALGNTRHTALALTHLEIAIFWAVKQLTGEPIKYSSAEIAQILEIMQTIKAD